MKGPKILLLDIETAPIVGYVWNIWEQNVGLNQIKSDWYIISWGAKWYDPKNPSVIYKDQRGRKNIEDDSQLLKPLWKLLDECDICVTQNGKAFDIKKINARFIANGFSPPSPFKQIDTKILAKRYFGFTSNRLEYMADKLNKKYKKLKHEKYAGFELWKECLKGNLKAWKEMEKYNKHDVLSLEELYTKLIPWDSSTNFNSYSEMSDNLCTCGNNKFQCDGFAYTGTGKFQRYRCTKCDKVLRGKQNLLSKDKRKNSLTNIAR